MDIYVQHIEQLFHTDCHMLLCNVMDIYVPYIIPQALYMYLALLGACTHQKFVILIGVRRKCSRRLLHPGFFHLPGHPAIRGNTVNYSNLHFWCRRACLKFYQVADGCTCNKLSHAGTPFVL
jgi:hypothetical protein